MDVLCKAALSKDERSERMARLSSGYSTSQLLGNNQVTALECVVGGGAGGVRRKWYTYDSQFHLAYDISGPFLLVTPKQT